MKGVSICILTYNVCFYNRLAVSQIRKHTKGDYELIFLDNGSNDGSTEWLSEQDDVKLLKREGNQLSHGQGLDLLAQYAQKPIICTLCSDAFPVSDDWLKPAGRLSEEVFLSGIDRGWGRMLNHYVCPSYLFGWTDWVKNHTFRDEWPNADTGEKMGQSCLDEGKKMYMMKYSCPDWGGLFKNNKPCDYAGLVWHTWMTGRAKTVPNVVGCEVEADYHLYVKKMLSKKYGVPCEI